MDTFDNVSVVNFVRLPIQKSIEKLYHKKKNPTNQQVMSNNEIILNIHQLLAYPNDQSKYYKSLSK